MLKLAAEEARKHKGEIDLLLVTATKTETDAVLDALKPLPGLSDVALTHIENHTYTLGMFGPIGAAHVQCVMGTRDAGSAMGATREAVLCWTPQAVVMPGIAWGNPHAKNLGLCDVLVASSVQDFENAKEGETHEFRGSQTEAGPKLLDRFRNVRGWHFDLPDGRRSSSRVGLLLSGDKLIANAEFRDGLLREFKRAIGGDMESYAVAQACRALAVEWIVAKGVCDWGDDGKNNDWQRPAAQASVSLCLEALNHPSSLDGLARARDAALPRSASRIRRVLHQRNPNFTGREALLARLERELASGRPTAVTQAISGLGGVGKSQLALEYAYRHDSMYDVVWWLRAEEPATLSSDFADLAIPLELPEQTATDRGVIEEAVLRWLDSHERWLLIFDNASAPDEIRRYIPKSATGHVIITSRNQAWRSLANPLPVEVWEKSESISFLQRRTGQDDRDGAAELADELGHLPLALEQAGAYIEETCESFSGYLEAFRSRRKELWARETPPHGYPATVATTWSLAMDRVAEEAPAAAELLSLCSFLSPDDIPRDLLHEGKMHLPRLLASAVEDRLQMDQAIAALKRFSLIEVGPDALAVHRLVQATVRDRLDDEARRMFCQAAVGVVNAAYRYRRYDVSTWATCERLLPHVLTSAGHGEEIGVAQGETGDLLNKTGMYLLERADFSKARGLLQRALTIGEAAYGPNHPLVATSVNNLGGVLRDQGDLAGARAHFERALTIDEAVYGPNHPRVATIVNNLGIVLQAQGDLAGARAHFERALTIDEAAYGPNHPEVAVDVNNLGDVLRDQGDLAGARAHFKRALTIDEAAYGPNHPVVARSVHNLGSNLRAQGDLVGARAHVERALTISEAAYGPNHPLVAKSVNNLGGVLRDQGDLAGARAHFERALTIDEAAYGPNHPEVAVDVNNLGGVLWDQGDLAGARAHLERALTINEAAYGPNHPVVARSVNNLGQVLQDQGDLAGARAHFERARAIDEAAPLPTARSSGLPPPASPRPSAIGRRRRGEG